MEQARIVHEFGCSEERLWQVTLFDSAYNSALYLDTLRFPKWRVLEQHETETGMTRRLEIQPLVENVPIAIRKVLGDQLGYIEDGSFERKSRRYTYRLTPNTMADKTRISGVMFSEARGEGRCVRVVEVEIEVKIMLVGRAIEQKTLEDTRATHERIAEFTRRYLSSNPS